MTDASVNETIRSIFSRRSVRQFTGRPVSNEDLTIILEAANQAPSAHNQQTWRFVVVRSERIRLELAQLARDRASKFSRISSVFLRRAAQTIAGAPVVVAVVNTGRLMEHSPELSDAEREADATIFRTMEIQNSAAAIENLLLAATSLGIGSVWLGILLLLKRQVLELLGEPSGELAAIVALGYPAGQTSAPEKTPLESLVRYVD
ncbi:MAG: nitroreductase family protein [Actinobacteria bacterium]|nr:nitroreductase family protein [Actinomycetota bacterium]